MNHGPFKVLSKHRRGLTVALVPILALAAAVPLGVALRGAGPALAAGNGRGAAASPHVGIFTTSLPSALSIDVEHETVTLPLFKGRTENGEPTWYIVTEFIQYGRCGAPWRELLREDRQRARHRSSPARPLR